MKLRHVLFAIYVMLCLGAMIWPGYAWYGNSIEPYVLGLPFSLAWIMGWVMLTFFVLVAYNATDEEKD